MKISGDNECKLAAVKIDKANPFNLLWNNNNGWTRW